MRRILLCATLALSACGDARRQPRFDAVGPLALDDALAYFDAGTSSLVVVDPAGGAGTRGNRRLARLGAGNLPVRAVPMPRPDGTGRAQILVVDPGDEQVLLVTDKRGTTDSLSIGVPLEAVDVAGDGRFAIAYEPDGATPTRSLFAFPNTVAVLDLRPGRLEARALRLGTPGARPLRAVFAESVRLTATLDDQGTPRTITREIPLALVFVRGGIIPLDLEKGVAGPVVPLAPDLDRDVIPAEVLFTNNAGDARRGTLDNLERAFVRSTAGELYVLALSLSTAAVTGDEGRMDVVVALENVVTPDATIEDVELYFGDDGNELLLAAAGAELILVDGYTGVASRFPQEVEVDTLVRFDDPRTGVALALGYARKNPGTSILRLDPLGLERRRSTGVEVLRLGNPITQVDVRAGSQRAVLGYSDGRDLGVLDLQQSGDVLDLRFAQALSAKSLSPSGNELYLVSRSPEDLAPHLAEVSLDELTAAQDVRLDADGAAVGRAGGWVWVDHGDPAGSVTCFPYDDLRREAGLAFSAVLFTDLLEREPPPFTTADGGGES